MSALPPLSICLVTYNRAELLPLTLNSILEQSLGDYELIISDDCSNDNTQQICLDFANRDSRIRYFRNEKNLGMPENLNSAIRHARGEYIANLHDGDIYRNDLLDKWKTALDTYPQAGLVFNAYRTKKMNGEEMIYRESYPPIINGREIGRRLLSRWDSCIFGIVMSRKSVYENLGLFDPQFNNYADIDMWLRIAKDYDVAYINEPLMDLMPKDTSRFYAFVHWKVTFWILGIHVTNLRRYRQKLPDFVEEMTKKYCTRRRSYILYRLLLCLKYRRWDRVKEAFAIWRDADDLLFRRLGKLMGRQRDLPAWYNPDYWEMARPKTGSFLD